MTGGRVVAAMSWRRELLEAAGALIARGPQRRDRPDPRRHLDHLGVRPRRPRVRGPPTTIAVMLAMTSIIVMRIKRPDLERPFRSRSIRSSARLAGSAAGWSAPHARTAAGALHVAHDQARSSSPDRLVRGTRPTPPRTDRPAQVRAVRPSRRRFRTRSVADRRRRDRTRPPACLEEVRISCGDSSTSPGETTQSGRTDPPSPRPPRRPAATR